jgi:hypothetical protein
MTLVIAAARLRDSAIGPVAARLWHFLADVNA